MRTAVIVTALALSGIAALGACTDPQRTGAPTTVTSSPSPHEMPGSSAPASPAESWTTEGGPASPGAPSSGDTVDPAIQNKHDGGVW